MSRYRIMNPDGHNIHLRTGQVRWVGWIKDTLPSMAAGWTRKYGREFCCLWRLDKKLGWVFSIQILADCKHIPVPKEKP